MKFPRASGILLHPTSLPGDFGIGDFGPQARTFVDFLRDAGQTYWQVLPLGPTGYGDSPYNCFSAFAGNTLLISPELLDADGLVEADHLASRPDFQDGKVDYGGVYEWKQILLPQAYATFANAGADALKSEFASFCGEHKWWLDDYAAYRAIKASQGMKPWLEWPDPLKLREKGAMSAAMDQLSNQIEAEKFYQFLFFRQWLSLKRYANENGVRIIGDVPIFVSLDSSDVWCNRTKFKLDSKGRPLVVSGVPPDYFSKTGQLWGNPIYDWEAMQKDGFEWWVARIAQALKLHDVVRIDHFRGFAAAWEVPAADRTAEHGAWVDAPGIELFDAVERSLGKLPLIVEDLGVITSDVEQLRDKFEFPGMKILQFAFGGDAQNGYLPHNYQPNCVAYTGTHDNDTTVGWWRSLPGPKKPDREHDRVRRFCLRYLGTDGREIHWDMIRAIWGSVADTAIAPAQDLLGLGTEGRMNLPASTKGNWFWRLGGSELSDDISARLRELTETYGRLARRSENSSDDATLARSADPL
jgi:4-alpha-glucanotransferase